MGRNLWLMVLLAFMLSCSSSSKQRKPQNQRSTYKYTESGRIQLDSLGTFYIKFIKADTAFYGVITHDLTTGSNNFMFNNAKFLLGDDVFEFAIQNNEKGMFLINNPAKFFENLRLLIWHHPLDTVTLVFENTDTIFFTELSTKRN